MRKYLSSHHTCFSILKYILYFKLVNKHVVHLCGEFKCLLNNLCGPVKLYSLLVHQNSLYNSNLNLKGSSERITVLLYLLL